MTKETKIKTAGFAIFVVGGTVAYFTRTCLSTEGADRTVFMGAVVVAVIGFGILIGKKAVKRIWQELMSATSSQPTTRT